MKRIRLFVFIAVMLVAGLASSLFLTPQDGNILLLDATVAHVGDDYENLRVFMKIENKGDADRIVAAYSPDAGKTMIYSPDPNVSVAIPAGAKPLLAPDGVHVVLRDVKGELDEGRIFPITLTFEKAGDVTTRARYGEPVKGRDSGEQELFGLGEICRVGKKEPQPEISLRVARDENNGWRILVDTTDFIFAEHLAGTTHVPGVGHGHLYVGGLKITRVYGNEIHLGALPKGDHIVRLALNTNDHRVYVVGDKPVMAEATIRVN